MPLPTANAGDVDVLVVSNIAADSERILRWLGNPAALRCRSVRTGYQMLEIVRTGRVPVVVCRTELPDTTWKHILITLQEFHLPPTVIVLSDKEDIDLWTEVLNQGGFDTIHKATPPDVARGLMRRAHRRWMRREEILTARKMNPRAAEAAEEQLAG